jgi:ABC-type multidrug transport system fused ATPase/permease subunit
MARNVNKFTNTVIMVSRKSKATQKLLVPLLHKSALGLTAGSMGLIYGQILGFGFYAYITPIIARLHGIPAEFVQANFVVIFGYIIYAQTLGTVYGQLLESHWFHPGRNATEQNAAFVGAIVGGLAGTGVLWALGGQGALQALGSLAGAATVRFGVAVYMVLAAVFGIAFAPVLARTINDFTNTVIMFSRRSKATQKILVPLITRAALAVTAGSMGLVYGAGIGVLFVVLGGIGLPLPQLGLAGVASFAVYGIVMGNVYGLLMEKLGMGGALLSEEQVAGLKAAPVAGVASGTVIFLLILTGVIPQSDPLLQAVGLWRGFAVWLGISVLFGLVFVAYVARTINDFTNTVIMFSRRSRATQKILVPLITRAALAVTAGSMGLVYGIGIGVFLVVLAGVGLPLPQLGLAGVASFAVYGIVMGNVYGLLMEKLGMGGALLSEEQVAGLKAAPVAGVASGTVIFLLILTGVIPQSDPLLQAVGLWRGFAVWLGISVLFGLVFVAYVARTINDFTNTVIMFSRRSRATQKILVPLITRAALTTTASSMGLGFGLGLGVLFYLLTVVGVLPATTPLVIVAFVLYGQALGINYGLQLEDVDLSLPDFGGEGGPVEEDPLEAGGFAAWRAQRPFAGSMLLILAGFIIGAIPIRIQMTFVGTTKASIGIAFAAMVLACGIFALVKPERSTLIGVTGIAMSILSLIGAFGGLVFGMLVGIVGGSLCVAWQDPNRDEEAAQESRFKWIGEGEQQW